MTRRAEWIGPEAWLDHRVSYGETDAMKQVYYAEYLHYFERARGALIRSCGVSYADVEERGIFLPVREATCRYRRPARYDQTIRVRVGVIKWTRASVTFGYEIYDEGRRELLAHGSTQHACVDATGRPVPFPAWFREILCDEASGRMPPANE